MDLERNATQTVEMQAFEVRRPSWSRDGKSLCYDSTSKGRPQVWKNDLASGHNQLVASAGSLAAIEDLSGSRLLYVETNYHRIWGADTDGADAQSWKASRRSRTWIGRHRPMVCSILSAPAKEPTSSPTRSERANHASLDRYLGCW
jgi:hypothetical protein